MSFFNEINETMSRLNKVLSESSTPVREEEETPDYTKELDAETVMFDCDAKNCKFWNEGFKGNCVLNSIEINAKSGCAQFEAKEESPEEIPSELDEYEDIEDEMDEGFDLFPMDEE